MDSRDSTGGEPHRPVMVEEVLHWLDPQPGGIYVDATLGAAGHAGRVAERLGWEGLLIGLDVDPEALEISRRRAEDWRCRFDLVQAGYEDLPAVLEERGIPKVDGILVDLGVSSMQLDRPERGFGFRSEGPLDCRMDPSQPISAAGWLEGATESEIRRVLFRYGEEKRAAAIARTIVREREKRPIRTTKQLADLVGSCFPEKRRVGRVHPATRTFQALRIVVNRELERLERLLTLLPSTLKEGGRVVILSYHSLEDRLVKRSFEKWSAKGDPVRSKVPLKGEITGPLRILTKKVVRPGREEIRLNPRARSARLRAAQRTDQPLE